MVKRYNLSDDAVKLDIMSFFERNAKNYKAMIVRCIAVPDEKGGAKSMMCAIRAVGATVPERTWSGGKYKNLWFLENVIDLGDFPTFISKLGSSDLEFPDGLVSLQVRMNEWEILPAQNDYGPQAVRAFWGHGDSNVHFVDEPLLTFGLPYFDRASEAIRQWFGISKFHGSSDGRLGKTAIFLPETDAIIEEVRQGQEGWSIALRRDPAFQDTLRIQGAWASGVKTQSIGFDAAGVLANVIPIDAKEFSIYLLGQNGSIYDWAQHTGYRNTGKIVELESSKSASEIENAIQKALREGEGPQIEFKKFIRPDHEKLFEVVKTVIAFGNTEGGIIYIGISDDCIIRSIEKEVQQFFKCPLSEALERYRGSVVKVIKDEVIDCPPVDVDIVEVFGEKLCVIIVEKSESGRKSYVGKSNDVYVRRGASSRKPRPDEWHDEAVTGRSIFEL